jgi:hypothetical protein
MAFHNPSDPKFLELWKDAVKKYEDDTKIKFATHALASCKNPDAVLDALDHDLQEFKDYRNKKERLRKWLKPMLHLIGSLSETAGEAAGVVRTPFLSFLSSTDIRRGSPFRLQGLASLRLVFWCRCTVAAYSSEGDLLTTIRLRRMSVHVMTALSTSVSSCIPSWSACGCTCQRNYQMACEGSSYGCLRTCCQSLH